MNRRSFANMLGGSLLTAGVGSQALASTNKSKSLYALAEAPYKMLYAPHFGMFKNHAGNDEIDQLKFMYDMGFRSLEDMDSWAARQNYKIKSAKPWRN